MHICCVRTVCYMTSICPSVFNSLGSINMITNYKAPVNVICSWNRRLFFGNFPKVSFNSSSAYSSLLAAMDLRIVTSGSSTLQRASDRNVEVPLLNHALCPGVPVVAVRCCRPQLASETKQLGVCSVITQSGSGSVVLVPQRGIRCQVPITRYSNVCRS